MVPGALFNPTDISTEIKEKIKKIVRCQRSTKYGPATKDVSVLTQLVAIYISGT
jgi:hypothetical protein